MHADALIDAAARSIASLAPAVGGLDRLSTELADIERATQRGYFTPDEDERVRTRFAEYLAARAGLLQTIDDLKPLALGETPHVDEAMRLRAFVAGYAATALLVRAGRFIVQQYAPNKIVQRKLNEEEPRLGIPRKQFTSIYRALTNPVNAWRIHEASCFADANRAAIQDLSRDPVMSPVLEHLIDSEPALRMSKRRFAKAYVRYRWHSWRRRRASVFGQAMFGLFEMSGRVIAELHNPWHAKRITPTLRQQIARHLHPGDVLISRHDDAASNLFLPGYWVHASLHIGAADQRRVLGVQVDSDRALRWVDPVCVLEAKKDGVRFRPLSETLAVDAVTVLRPRLDAGQIARALSQAVTHEGKLYDFEFDFFRSDRLVCTEVVYRGFHGVGGIDFTLSRRAGRPTLAAEDLLRMALDRRGFEVAAVCDVPNCGEAICMGAQAAAAVASTIGQGKSDAAS